MKLTAQHFARRWYMALKGSEASAWPEISKGMLSQVLRLGMKRDLPAIKKVMERLYLAENKVIEVVVTSAKPDQTKEEQKLLKDLFGSREVQISRRVDPALLGGIIVETQDDRWDFSVRQQLHRLSRGIND
mgnify:CR=1 FL=1